MRAFPLSMKELLDAIPLFISSYICHFNVLPIHNELICPTSDRVKTWIRTSIWPATLFYYVIGFTGSLFVKCTASKSVQGNILLDFNEDDPLLLLGRLCLAVTITLAFPVLIIPPRDILVRLVVKSSLGRRWVQRKTSNRFDAADVPIDISDSEHSLDFQPIDSDFTHQTSMEEPLLVLEDRLTTGIMHDDNLSVSYEYFDGMSVGSRRQTMVMSEDEEDNIFVRKIVAFTIFWSAAALACSVKSIDVVWDLVGSSFSIMLAFLIPCGAYLKLSSRVSDDGIGFTQPRTVARIMILVFVPLMLLSTMNAVYNSFFQ
jgi:amino acid permease